MPKNEHLKGVVFLAAAKAEAIIHTYPTHFYDIEEAKAYVDAACEKADLKYITSKHMTEDEMEYVKDRACFIVAAKAFGQGEFYLKVELADPRALRTAVEADIKRLLPLVPYWPSSFPSVQHATLHVERVARWSRFVYEQFEGVEEKKFRAYVNFNTARHAFEAGRFDMDVPGKGWRRPQLKTPKAATASKAPIERFGTMKKAIEFDVQRLLVLVSPWPTKFPSLNAARDHVFSFVKSTSFSFTYWPEVGDHRFRLFVNYNTAKRAFELGKFKIEVDEKEEEEEEEEEEAGAGAGGGGGGAAGGGGATLICASNVQEVAHEITMPSVDESDEDPFKDLIAVLKRESILKIAFE